MPRTKAPAHRGALYVSPDAARDADDDDASSTDVRPSTVRVISQRTILADVPCDAECEKMPPGIRIVRRIGDNGGDGETASVKRRVAPIYRREGGDKRNTERAI